jgi:hypothetical protein
MVLAQKQIWRPVKQNTGPRDEPMQLCPPNFWQRHQEHMIDKKIVSSTNVAGKTGYLPAENWN